MALSLDDRGVVVSCASCGRTNRLLYRALDKQTRCGHCKAPLTPPSAPIAVPSTAAFDAAVAGSALPLVVDFWAPWCGPCRMVAPELEKVAREGAGKWVVAQVNTGSAQNLAHRFRINAMPTMALFKDGLEVTRQAGAMAAPAIRKFLAPHV